MSKNIFKKCSKKVNLKKIKYLIKKIKQMLQTCLNFKNDAKQHNYFNYFFSCKQITHQIDSKLASTFH